MYSYSALPLLKLVFLSFCSFCQSLVCGYIFGITLLDIEEKQMIQIILKYKCLIGGKKSDSMELFHLYILKQ